jgi:hypothetical protein
LAAQQPTCGGDLHVQVELQHGEDHAGADPLGCDFYEVLYRGFDRFYAITEHEFQIHIFSG